MFMQALLARIVTMTLLFGSAAFGNYTGTNATAADNSRINDRDRSSVTELTADKSGNSKSDINIAREIRKSISDRADISTYGHNIKIIATNGVVTLKGPVRSQAELNTIKKIAADTCGNENVRNEMQIVSGE